MKYCFWIAFMVLVFACFPLMLREQRYHDDMGAVREILRSEHIDDSDLSLTLNRSREEIYTFSATEEQLQSLLKRLHVKTPVTPGYNCDDLGDQQFCSHSVLVYGWPENHAVLPGVGHPGILVLYRLPGTNRTKLLVGWDFAI